MINFNGSVTSQNRVSGLISGIDTESIIKSSMAIEQLKIDRQFKAKAKLEWKKETITSVSNTLKNFKNEFMSVLNSSKLMSSATALNNFKAEVTGASKSAVSVSAGIYASAKSFSILSTVKATAANATSAAGVTDDGATLNLGTSLEALNESGILTNNFVFEDDKISFSVNDEVFTFDKTASLRTVINTVNASNVGVTMSYSSVANKFTFESKTTGSESEFRLSGSALSAFGITEGTYKNGNDAELTIKEGSYTRTFKSASNSFNIDGVGVTVNKDFRADAAAGVEAIGVEVTRDIDASIKKIKDFFEGFNKLYKEIFDKINEPRYSNFDPLTDAQKKEMKESDIKLWEEKAKSGLFKGDADMMAIASALRGALTEPMSQATDGYSFAKIGISFGSYFSSEKDSIVIDEEKLRKALTENPDAVAKLFFNESAAKDSPTAMMGITQRISKTIDTYTSKFKDTTLKNLDKSISSYGKIMDELTLQMNKKEEALWQRFAAMESAIAKANSQGSWISSMMG